jgi:hypothetical protein
MMEKAAYPTYVAMDLCARFVDENRSPVKKLKHQACPIGEVQGCPH